MDAEVDVLIPTCNRPAALAVTLASLLGASGVRFNVHISDQSDGEAGFDAPEAAAVIRVLEVSGHEVARYRNLPRRGLAHQRQYLLERAQAPYVLFLDDDVILQSHALACMRDVIHREKCGFVANAVIGLTYANDIRPHQQAVEFWSGRVQPERIEPGSSAWSRHLLHNAANLLHVQRNIGASVDAPRRYKLAWAGGCVLYDRSKLLDCDGFSFWTDLPPEHCGEDVLAQLRVMERYGGCGVMPSGAFHQELPTTVQNREVDAPWLLVKSSAVSAT